MSPSSPSKAILHGTFHEVFAASTSLDNRLSKFGIVGGNVPQVCGFEVSKAQSRYKSDECYLECIQSHVYIIETNQKNLNAGL